MTQAQQIIDALGGSDNITDLEACITRLRSQLVDPTLVDEEALSQAGTFGVVSVGKTVQVIVGPSAETVAEEINSFVKTRYCEQMVPG